MADATHTTNAPRRTLLTTALALVALPAAASPPPMLPNPDADLIRLCGEYMEALNAYNRSRSTLEPDVDPLWLAIEGIEDQLDGLTATTIEGIVAKAQVALSQARLPDGSENFSTSFTGNWPEQVVRDVLRLFAPEARA